MKTHRFKQVDVFTQQPFMGNPVAVVIGVEALTAEQMQRIAAWTNLSETTFILPSERADYCLRIFTPRRELGFAGHPVIGSAHAALESGYAAARGGVLRQECAAGIFDLSVEENAEGRRIFVRAPGPKISGFDAADTLAAALGARICPSPLLIETGPKWIVADVASAEKVAAAKPDLNAVAEISAARSATGVVIFGKAEDGVSALHVRAFAPGDGIPEDPVCGSGNAAVGAFLHHTGASSEYGSAYIARQGMNVGRDGRIAVRVGDDGVVIGGSAVTTVDGHIGI
ncbi:MAG TPA: PhzF family phenazine biosynthesis protein [Candidatus Binatia bacterium]|jgi:PhzF family phenazine biosynthesis protein